MRHVILGGFLFAVTAIVLAPGAAAAETSSVAERHFSYAVPQTEEA